MHSTLEDVQSVYALGMLVSSLVLTTTTLLRKYEDSSAFIAIIGLWAAIGTLASFVGLLIISMSQSAAG